MTQPIEQVEHRILANGIELAVHPLAGRGIATMEIRFFAGYSLESPEHLGTAHVLAETISKGTAQHDGRGLNDAFDEIGATYAVGAGRETITFTCLALPEFLTRAIDLQAEMIRTPTLPDDACRVAVELTRQTLAAMNDEPHELAKKLLHQHAYGQPLGRHLYGEDETLARIDRAAIHDHWRQYLRPDRMQIAVAGGIDPQVVVGAIEKAFGDFAPADSSASAEPIRKTTGLTVSAGQWHHPKTLEQEQIAICLPGASAGDADEAVERVVLAILSGGMSSRLWSNVREKQGLVYWVGAWFDRPRLGGAVHLGASTTPENLEKTYTTLLAELAGLADDLTQDELDRAITGILATTQMRGDLTRARTARLANDLFYHGRPIPLHQRLERIRSTTLQDVCDYLHQHPRDQLSVLTLGPKELELTTES